MNKKEAIEAATVVNVTLDALLTWAPTRGRAGSELRTAVNDVRASALSLLQNDSIGQPLADCFDIAVSTGATIDNMENVRAVAAASNPVLVGAILTRNSLIQFCLVTQAQILSNTTFVSREDVQSIRAMFNASFAAIEEDVADRMDAMTYRAIVELHAAVSFYLVETARPLPRILRYSFNLTLPTLAMAQRLYYDAGRADELLAENKMVHPAFAPRSGIALSN